MKPVEWLTVGGEALAGTRQPARAAVTPPTRTRQERALRMAISARLPRSVKSGCSRWLRLPDQLDDSSRAINSSCQDGSVRFNLPPGWPEPPRGWSPPPGWQPDPTWPPAPPEWSFWIADPGAAASSAIPWLIAAALAVPLAVALLLLGVNAKGLPLIYLSMASTVASPVLALIGVLRLRRGRRMR